jgi:two-component system chemotaxis response regulator CheY
MNILVVDDSSAMRMMIVRTLRQVGIPGGDISQAEDGAIAFEKIKADLPDLILCDWNMPNMTGIELLHAMNDANINIDFGFITTESTTEMRQKANDAGAKFLIAKPFSAASFEKVLSIL